MIVHQLLKIRENQKNCVAFSQTHTHAHTSGHCREERVLAAASLTTKGRRVDVCADTGECVDICDTLSQQMYVISFRRVERGGGSERERERGKKE